MMRSVYSKLLLQFQFKRNRILFCAILLVKCCVFILIFYFINVETHYGKTFIVNKNISIYSTIEYEYLQDVGTSYSPPVTSIHFHETSSNGGLNTRQACAVESAAVAHPSWQINVYFVGSVMKNMIMNVLKKYDNVKLFKLNLVDYALGTPLQSLIASGALNRSNWKIYHTSDALRYISLYKWGGVYLDLDVVVARSFEELAPNWAARESGYAIAAGALAFSKDEMGRKIANATIRDFKKNYRGDRWGNNGPGVITRVLSKMCSTKIIAKMSAKTCKGFEIYGPEMFYPVSWQRAKDYFGTKELQVEKPYTYHVWNKFTKNLPVKKESFYAKLAQKYCPKVYQTYGTNFGS